MHTDRAGEKQIKKFAINSTMVVGKLRSFESTAFSTDFIFIARTMRALSLFGCYVYGISSRTNTHTNSRTHNQAISPPNQPAF